MMANSNFLTLEILSSEIKNSQFGVKSTIYFRWLEIEQELKKGIKKEFDRTIRLNGGDCHAAGQKPITFIRQLMAVCLLPELLNDDRYPSDVKERANNILNDCVGRSLGSYIETSGLKLVKAHVARFIEDRDGVPSSPDDIFITAGAGDAIRLMIHFVLTNRNDKPAGFMIPIPEFPIYSATVTSHGGHQIYYFLNEDKNWELNIDELQRAYDESLDKCIPKAIIIINPGNPTGQVLSRKNIEEIVKFAYKNKLIIMTDEVYQLNVYGVKFYSIKKVAYEMGSPYKDMLIFSFFSCSKGYTGECGVRAGYVDLTNMEPLVKAELKKLCGPEIIASSPAHVCLDAVANPPKENEPSYELFEKEKNFVLNELKIKAKLVTETFNSIEGLSCTLVQGAMYAFPKIALPPKAIQHA